MNFLIFAFNGLSLLEAAAGSVKHYQIVTFDIWQGKQDSNPHRRFWRPLNYPCSIPLYNAGRLDVRLEY